MQQIVHNCVQHQYSLRSKSSQDHCTLSTRAPAEPSAEPHLTASASSYLGISAPCTWPQPAAPHLSTCGISSPSSPCSVGTHSSIRSPRCPVSQLQQAQGGFHDHPLQLSNRTPVGASLSGLQRRFLIPEAASLIVGWTQAAAEQSRLVRMPEGES